MSDPSDRHIKGQPLGKQRSQRCEIWCTVRRCLGHHTSLYRAQYGWGGSRPPTDCDDLVGQMVFLWREVTNMRLAACVYTPQTDVEEWNALAYVRLRVKCAEVSCQVDSQVAGSSCAPTSSKLLMFRVINYSTSTII